MVGDGATKEKLIAEAGQKSLKNLRFFDHRPKKEMPAILASCDASLVPLVSRLPGTMPSKVYEALAAGTPPIVAKGCEGQALVEQFDAGRAFEPMDAEELAEAVRDLADHPDKLQQARANSTQLARRFDRDVIAERTEAVLRAVAERKPLPQVSW